MDEHDAYLLTKAASESLGLKGEKSAVLSVGRVPIPLHDGSLRYYKETGAYPADEGIDWYVIPGTIMACLSILIVVFASAQAILRVKREHIANQINRQISVDGRVPIAELPRQRIIKCIQAGAKLVEVRVALDELRERRWYDRRREIDKSRWEKLNSLIDRGLRHLKEAATAAATELVIRSQGQDAAEDIRTVMSVVNRQAS